jgi:hypothetical protein
MTEPDEVPEVNQLQVANLTQSRAETVNAELVRMHQASTASIHANEVGLQQSAAAAIQANSVGAHLSALAAVEAEEVVAQNSVIGFLQSEKASVSGYSGAIVATNAEVHYGITGLVAGNEVHAEGARAVFLVGRKVGGNVTTLMDSRSALIAGLTGGLFAGLMFLLGRALFGRK